MGTFVTPWPNTLAQHDLLLLNATLSQHASHLLKRLQET